MWLCSALVRVRRANARVGRQYLTEGGHTGRYLESHRWLDGTCQALRPIGRLPTVLAQYYWASASTRPATAWPTLCVSICAADAVTSPAGHLPGWADDDAATARSRARIAPRRCPLSMSDMRASRCVLKSGYNYIPLFLKLITRSSRHYSKSAERHSCQSWQ
eukprot:scaffold10220_cov144-Isochrysis_galbana.AAC.6